MIRALAARILKRMPRYSDFASELPPQWVRSIELAEGEQLIGAYCNDPGSAEGAVIITSEGIRWSTPGGWRCVPYRTVARVVPVEPSEKMLVEEVTLQLRDGEIVKIPVRGRRGRFADVFEFGRFVARAVALYPSI
jgi:hypothetical protein